MASGHLIVALAPELMMPTSRPTLLMTGPPLQPLSAWASTVMAASEVDPIIPLLKHSDADSKTVSPMAGYPASRSVVAAA